MKIDTIKSGGQSQGGLDNAGGTLSGPLMLSRDPQVPMEAATKRYVDTALSNLSASNVVSGTLPIARLPAFSGDITNEAGSNNMVLSNTGIALGEYGKIVVDAKGRATNGTGLGNSDIPNFDFSKITTDKPTTLAGFGITDCVSLAGGVMTGPLVLSGSPVSGDNLVPKQYLDGMVNTLSASKTGDVIRKAYATTPSGFLKCNGAEVSKTTYADLYAVIGESNNSYNVIGSGQPWRQQYEINTQQSAEISTWNTGTALPAVVVYSAVIVTKNRVYLLGGNNGSATVSTVYTAPINSDGTIGAWSTSTSLPGAISRTQAVLTKNRVYLIGGKNSAGNTINIMYSAPVNSDGTLGTWTVETNLPPAGTSFPILCLVKSKLFIIGGAGTASAVSSVYSCTVNADGTLGTWVTETSLPAARGYAQGLVIKNRIYVIGGYDATGVGVNTVYYADISSTGNIGTWNTGTALPTPLIHCSSFVTKNGIYICGGTNNSSYLSTTYFAPINADGTIGTWVLSTSLPSIMTGSQLIVTSSKVYIFGSRTSDVGFAATVVYANVSGGLNDYSAYYEDTSTNYMMPGSGLPWEQQYQLNESQAGNITGWTTATSLPTTLSTAAVFVTKNRVYLCGGYINDTTQTSAVYTATINTDGTLGTWNATTNLPNIANKLNAVVTKNRVYLLAFAVGSSATNTVYTASINADGTIGSWSTATSLPGAISWTRPFVTKNRIYICGGAIDSSTPVATVYTAPINTDGTIGTWTTGTSLPTAIGWTNVVITKNRVYLLGGFNGTSVVSTIYSAIINSNGTLGTWSNVGSLPITNHWTHVFVSKNTIYTIAGHNGSGAISSVYYCFIKPDGTLSSWTQGTSLPNVTNAASIFVTKNRIYLCGGTASSIVYTATVAEGLNDYSAYYDGTIAPFEPVDQTTTFKLPDMSATDVNGIYHYIKY